LRGGAPPGSPQEDALFDKCANGRCAEAFDYRKGRLFRFQYKLRNVEAGTGHAVVHFWLCPKCSKVYTLEYREKSGVAVLRLKNPPSKGSKAREREVLSQAAAAGATK
jgi:hypothetical protein